MNKDKGAGNAAPSLQNRCPLARDSHLELLEPSELLIHTPRHR